MTVVMGMGRGGGCGGGLAHGSCKGYPQNIIQLEIILFNSIVGSDEVN